LFNIPILHRYIDALLSIVDESVKDPTNLQILNKPYESFRNDCLKTLDNIENGSRRINQIVSNLREYVRERDKGKVKAIQIKPFIEQILSLCIGRIRKSVRTFEVNIAEDLPPFVTDSLALEQILINLLINAAQASDKEDSWVKLSVFMLRTAQPKLVIQVQDNGCGMDVETQKKIFQPFFTTKEIGEGTGIGLAIVDKLVMELKGQIEVESVKGQGSVFRLIFNVDPKTLEPSALEPKVG
jgi:C4-dicarboxylate-specific signal transduction histidine kinase